MKKWLITLCVLSSAFLCANSADRVGALASKVVLQNTNGYFVLTDGSCWKVVPFAKRWRTISEWWNNVEIVPENYESSPKDWFIGTQVEAYSKFNNLEVSEKNASNQETLKQCTHILVNSRTGQVLFGIQLDPADCILQLYNDAHDEGHKKGVDQGRMSAYKNSTESFNAGRAEGYKLGYAEGFQEGLKEGLNAK